MERRVHKPRVAVEGERECQLSSGELSHLFGDRDPSISLWDKFRQGRRFGKMEHRRERFGGRS